MANLFARKKIDDLIGVTATHALKRSLGPVDVALLGVGAIVGGGIFATIGSAAVGDAARPGAGPSLMLSFLITAVVCAFTAMAYAELASMVPVSGSAYTYAYAALGEVVAWVIGWDLILEYAISNVAVAISWANYFRALLQSFGIAIPWWVATDMRSAGRIEGLLDSAPHLFGFPIVFNLLALSIIALLTALLVWGMRESARLNNVFVLLKIVVLLFFMGVAAAYVSPPTMVANWQPFFPAGANGTLSGAAVVFFAYIGFDSVSTVAEEARRPSRTIPIGIIASLVVCAVLYVAVAAAFTGLLPLPALRQVMASGGEAEPLSMALKAAAPQASWAIVVIAFGAVVAQTTALLAFQVGQSRIFFAMARDGLLPRFLGKVHPRFHTPHVTTWLAGALVGGIATVASIDEMVDLTNIGTLWAFVVVALAVTILRFKEPHRPRAFRVPFGPWLVPMLGAGSCLSLMWYLPPASWWRFWGWLVAGLTIYALYGYGNSTLAGAARRKVGLRRARACGVGLLAMTAGLFLLPHDASLLSVGRDALHADSINHARSFNGLALLVAGLVWGACALVLPRAKPPAHPPSAPN